MKAFWNPIFILLSLLVFVFWTIFFSSQGRERPSALLFDAATLPATTPKFIFGVTVLASVSSSLCRLQYVVRDVFSFVGIFLRVLGTLPLLTMADYLFRSHLLDVVGDAVEGVSDFSLRRNTHVTDLVLLLLDVTILACGWM